MTEKEHVKLVSVGNRFWAAFSRIVAEALAEFPDSFHPDAIPYLQDKTSIYGSTYDAELKKLRTARGRSKPEASAAATAWFDSHKHVPGLYVVQFLCDAFPAGDPNNVCHQLVHVGSDGQVLHDGRFRTADEMLGWKWARVIPHA